MKNIHILPAKENSPSRLHINAIGNLGLNPGFTPIKNPLVLYITSYENVKKGVRQWYLDKFLDKPMNSNGAEYGSKLQVIVLTTNTTLIADGVQSINDEFLEWFVKNSSCEFVEVEKVNFCARCYSDDVDECWSAKECSDGRYDKISYKTIMPQEEPEQLTPESFIQEISTNLGKTIPETLEHIENFSKDLNKLKSQPKQETLEEAAENYSKLKVNKDGLMSDKQIKDFISGAKWQAERMYSEEEMYSALQKLRLVFKSGVQKWQEDFEFDLDKWFEQTKNK